MIACLKTTQREQFLTRSIAPSIDASRKGTLVVYSGVLICLDDRAIGTQLDTQ
jgi:hypothetical protein